MSAEDVTSALHTPHEHHFRDHPEAAHVTLHAHGFVGADGMCKIESGKPGVDVGVHPILGGDGKCACAGDMLLEALVGCAGVTLGQMATAMEIDLRKAAIHAEGDLDVRGLLGMSEQVPVGLQNIRLHFDVESDATEEQLPVLVRLTERYCVVSRTLNPPAAITFSSSKPDSSDEKE
jgi:uncharacterized OsmC-like protein